MKREACGALSCIGYKLIFFFFFFATSTLQYLQQKVRSTNARKGEGDAVGGRALRQPRKRFCIQGVKQLPPSLKHGARPVVFMSGYLRGEREGKGRNTLHALRDARRAHADARPARALEATTRSRVKRSVGRWKCWSGNGAIVDKPSGPRRNCAVKSKTATPTRPALDMR